MNELMNQIIPLLITCILGILAVVIKSVGDVAKQFVIAKREEVLERISRTKYEGVLSMAMDIWGIVDEEFRLSKSIGNVADEKITMFNKLLLQKIPTLEQKEIDFIRQTIAGQVNALKEAVIPPKEE